MSEIQIFAPFYFEYGEEGSGKQLDFGNCLIIRRIITFA